jgi:hypothetical protein
MYVYTYIVHTHSIYKYFCYTPNTTHSRGHLYISPINRHAEAAAIEQDGANNEGRGKERVLTRGRGRTVLIAREKERGREGGREGYIERERGKERE